MLIDASLINLLYKWENMYDPFIVPISGHDTKVGQALLNVTKSLDIIQLIREDKLISSCCCKNCYKFIMKVDNAEQQLHLLTIQNWSQRSRLLALDRAIDNHHTQLGMYRHLYRFSQEVHKREYNNLLCQKLVLLLHQNAHPHQQHPA